MNKTISKIVVLYIMMQTLNEVIYNYYLHKNDKLNAWFARPIYGFKMFWFNIKENNVRG